MKKPKKNKRPVVGPPKPLDRLAHEPDAKITVIINYIENVENVTIVQGGGGMPMDSERRKFIEKCIAAAGGFLFVMSLLVLTVVIPQPTISQSETFRTVMAVGAAGCAAVIPGFLNLKFGKWLSAGGALAVFAAVYFLSPAVLGLK